MYYKLTNGIIFSTVQQELPLASEEEVEEQILNSRKHELLLTIKTTVEKTLEEKYPQHKQLNHLLGLYGEDALKEMRQFIQEKRQNYKQLEDGINNALTLEKLKEIEATIGVLLS